MAATGERKASIIMADEARRKASIAAMTSNTAGEYDAQRRLLPIGY